MTRTEEFRQGYAPVVDSLELPDRIALVYRPERLAELFAALKAARWEPKRMQLLAYHRDKAPYAVLVEAVKDGGPGLEILPVHYQTQA